MHNDGHPGSLIISGPGPTRFLLQLFLCLKKTLSRPKAIETRTSGPGRIMAVVDSFSFSFSFFLKYIFIYCSYFSSKAYIFYSTFLLTPLAYNTNTYTTCNTICLLTLLTILILTLLTILTKIIRSLTLLTNLAQQKSKLFFSFNSNNILLAFTLTIF